MHLDIDSCIIESRVQVARNLKAYPFPVSMDAKTREQLVLELKEIFSAQKVEEACRLEWRSDNEIGYAQQKVFDLLYGFSYKKHENMPYHIAEDTEMGLTVFVAAEDHMNMFIRDYGFVISRLFEDINRIDDLIDSLTEYAFDSELGYLTSEVTNVGTAIHGTVLIHLPMLFETGQMEGISQAAAQLGLGIARFSEAGADAIYKIQNHITLGRSEMEIIDTICEIVKQLAKKENDALSGVAKAKSIELEDRIYRSLGLLQKARLLSRQEVLGHLSNIRTGIRLGLFENLAMKDVDALIFSTDSGQLQLSSHKILNAQELSAERSLICRTFFKKEG